MYLARSRSLFFMAFLASCLVLGAAMYIERSVGLHPCSLCLVQRFFVVMFGAVCLLAALHAPRAWGIRLYAGAGLVMAVGGGVAATRQVWLQGLPGTVEPKCQAGLGYLWQSGPWSEALKVLFLGAPDCTQITWSLLDMTLPEWSLLAFAGMALFSMLQLLSRARSPSWTSV